MSAISEEEAVHLLTLQTIVIRQELEKTRKKRLYVRPIFARRKSQGDYYHLVRELELSESANFERYARFSPELLEEVLRLVGPKLIHLPNHRTPVR